MLDFLLVFSLPKLVFDDEMCGQALRFVRDIHPVDDLPVGPLIDQLMADQHLIMAEHTMAHWPDELYLPSSIVDRDNREQWTKLGAKDTYQRACDDVDRRLAAYRAAGDRPAARRGAAADHPGRPRDADRAAGHPAGARADGRGAGRDRRARSAGATPPGRLSGRWATSSDDRIGRSLFDPIDPAARLRPARDARSRTTSRSSPTSAATAASRSRRTARRPWRRRSSGDRPTPARGRSPSRTRGRRRWRVDAGIERILIANEVVDDAGLAWIGDVLDRRAARSCMVLADSVVGVERMALRLAGRRRPLPVLIDVGVAGGRTGVRTADEAEAVAEAVDGGRAPCASPASRSTRGSSAATPARRGTTAVRALTIARRARSWTRLEPLFERAGIDEIVVTGGGSTYPDVVADELARPWTTALPVRVVLRSGAYITHDHGLYERESPFGMRAAPGAPRLEPAIEVWAPVVSAPEPGLAVAGAGRRDLPVDQELPVVIKVRGADGRRPRRRAGLHGDEAQRPARVHRPRRTAPTWPSGDLVGVRDLAPVHGVPGLARGPRRRRRRPDRRRLRAAVLNRLVGQLAAADGGASTIAADTRTMFLMMY